MTRSRGDVREAKFPEKRSDVALAIIDAEPFGDIGQIVGLKRVATPQFQIVSRALPQDCVKVCKVGDLEHRLKNRTAIVRVEGLKEELVGLVRHRVNMPHRSASRVTPSSGLARPDFPLPLYDTHPALGYSPCLCDRTPVRVADIFEHLPPRRA